MLSCSVLFSYFLLVVTLLRCHAQEQLRFGPFHHNNNPLLIQTPYGPIIGSTHTRGSSTIRRFLGIPYASPPTSSLRFKPPVPPQPWSSPKRVQSLPPACPQPLPIPQSESCLFLNIYTPLHAASSNTNRNNYGKEGRNSTDETNPLLPVIIWIHGGAFLFGSPTLLSIQAPEYLVHHHDIIFVSIQYRLGPLGFLTTSPLPQLNTSSLTETDDERVEPNLGLLDQLAAIRYVSENIHLFGGDASRITLWGESAGAMAIGMHMTGPLKDAFSRVIMQSNVWTMHYRNQSEATDIGNEFVKRLKCTTWKCLQSVPLWKITRRFPPGPLRNHPHVLADLLTWAPVIDNRTVLGFPLSILSRTPTHHDVLIGYNNDETSLALTMVSLLFPLYKNIFSYDRYVALLKTVFGDISESVLKMYDPRANYDSTTRSAQKRNGNEKNRIRSELIRLTTDYLVACPTLSFSHSRRHTFTSHTSSGIGISNLNQRPRFYMYKLSFTPHALPRFLLRDCVKEMCHGVDMVLSFHSLQPFFKFDKVEHTVSHAMVDLWMSFVKDGTPRVGHQDQVRDGTDMNGMEERMSRKVHDYGKDMGEDVDIEWKEMKKDEWLWIMENGTFSMQSGLENKECEFWNRVGYRF